MGLVAMFGVSIGPRQATAQSLLPDMDVVLVLEIADAAGWIALQEEALVTPPPGAKPLEVSVAATTGGRRSITLGQPNFEVAIIRGLPAFKVTVRAKLTASAAIGTLGPFEYALTEKAGDAEVGLLYGLSTVTARLLEVYVTRP